MGDNECKIHPGAMREVYMLVILNLEMSHDKYPPPTGNPHNKELKIGDLVLIENQTPQSPFDAKYRLSYRIIKRIGDKSFDMQAPTNEKSICTVLAIPISRRILCNHSSPNGSVSKNH